MTRVRWGILSTGRIAQQFARDLAHVENAELVAVAARSPESARHFAASLEIPRAHESYADLFADSGVDAIYVATPHTLHLEHSAAALRAGKAVLCEKPLTTTAVECAALIDVARATGGYLMEGMWTFFLPALRKARQWIAAGDIGALRHIKADFGYPLLPYDPQRREYDASLAGGCLLEMGIYPLALTELLLQREPVSLRVVARRAPNGVEDDVSMLLEYPNCTATLATSFRAKLQNWAYVIGETGYIAIPDFWRARECHLYRLDERIDYFSDGRRHQGFAFEAAAVSDDILASRTESAVVPWSLSHTLQRRMEQVRALF